MEKVIIVPSGTLSASEKIDLQNKGFVVIVCDEPEKIKLLGEDNPSDKRFIAALQAIVDGKDIDTRRHFCIYLLDALKGK